VARMIGDSGVGPLTPSDVTLAQARQKLVHMCARSSRVVGRRSVASDPKQQQTRNPSIRLDYAAHMFRPTAPSPGSSSHSVIKHRARGDMVAQRPGDPRMNARRGNLGEVPYAAQG
jgi:hypothetical protein